MKATVALPTWKNGDILWLPLEGLVRQKTSYPWELVIMECEGDSTEIIEQYKEALTKAGCEGITYINSPYRVPLASKWKQIAEAATGDVFMLQASDDFHSKDRIERTMKAFEDGAEWYQTRYHYHWSFVYHKLIVFDMLTKAGWKATGFNMAMLTNKVRKVPETNQGSGIDFFLFSNIKPEKVVTDEVDPKGGVATDGMNTISVRRFNYYLNTQPPFHTTDKGIHDIGIPKFIADKLSKLTPEKDLGRKGKLTGKKVPVVFARNYKGRRAGYEYFVDEAVRDYLQYRGIVAREDKGKITKTKL